jgi:hypothetical protein
MPQKCGLTWRTSNSLDNLFEYILSSWQMNTNHTVKWAGQEARHLAVGVRQVCAVSMSVLIEAVFLNRLLKEHNSLSQLLQFLARTLDQIVETLSICRSSYEKWK